MTISVIIPTFNRAHVLRRAIDSVFAQTFQKWELVIVDDGSTDDTAELVASIARPEIRLLRHEKNLGQNPALNTGVKASRGVFCAFLDSDDEWRTDYLEKVMSRFVGDRDLGCVYTWAASRHSGGKLRVDRRFGLDGWIYAGALRQGYVAHMITLTARRELIIRVGMFDERFSICQDDDICLRLAEVAKFGLIKEPLAIIHTDAGDQATSNTGSYAIGFARLIAKFEGEIMDVCGPKVLAGHLERSGDLWLAAGEQEKAIEAYLRSTNLGDGSVKGKFWLATTPLPPKIVNRCIGIINRVRRRIGGHL